MERRRLAYIALVSSITLLVIALSLGSYSFFASQHMAATTQATPEVTPDASASANTQVLTGSTPTPAVTPTEVVTPTATTKPKTVTQPKTSVKPTVAPTPTTAPATVQNFALANKHYEYVFPDGGMFVYDMDNGHKLVKQVTLPTQAV